MEQISKNFAQTTVKQANKAKISISLLFFFETSITHICVLDSQMRSSFNAQSDPNECNAKLLGKAERLIGELIGIICEHERFH